MTAKGAVPLYFGFPDGVHHHVCAECTALCCRGHGFGGSLKREMGQFLSIGDPDLTFAAFLALREIHASTGVLEALEKAIKPSSGRRRRRSGAGKSGSAASC